MSADFQPGNLSELACFGDLLVTGRRRQMSPRRKLDIVDAHALQMPDRLGQGVLAERNRLHSDRKAAPLVLLIGGGENSRRVKTRRKSNRRHSEKPATREIGVHY